MQNGDPASQLFGFLQILRGQKYGSVPVTGASICS
jgi:hypothetical protein